MEELQKEAENSIEKVAREINVNLPLTNLPLPLKIITLLITIGGLSITASALTDVFNPNDIGLAFYLLRAIAGVTMLAIAYGLIKRRRWSIWIYGIIVVIGVFINPGVSILPLLILIYLYTKRAMFAESIFDKWANILASSIYNIRKAP